MLNASSITLRVTQHGITSRTASLTYANESGALSESWSEVFGAMVEL